MQKGMIYYGRAPESTGPRAEAYRLGISGKRRCISCRLIRKLSAFNRRSGGRYYKSICRLCDARQFSGWAAKNQPKNRSRANAYHQRMKEQRWQEVLNALGQVCACCGEPETDFLTVDHIHRDGYLESRQRSGRALWSRIRNEGYPKNRYRILCFNCNMGRERRGDGVCPHQRKLRAVS